MKGRAHRLFREFCDGLKGASAPFLRSRLILMAQVNPDELTEELDSAETEARLEQAIGKLVSQVRK
jgi:hypothetical protein